VSNKAIRERETELWHMREALKSYEAQLAQAVKERDAERHAGEALVRQVQARNKHIAEVRALHSECIIERDTAIRQRDALAEHLRTITADNLVPRAELDAAVAERDVAVAEAERMMGNVLCYSISGPPVALIEVMQRRYGRAAHQWKHNHDERKSRPALSADEVEVLRKIRDYFDEVSLITWNRDAVALLSRLTQAHAETSGEG
jgi:hypothetical protein